MLKPIKNERYGLAISANAHSSTPIWYSKTLYCLCELFFRIVVNRLYNEIYDTMIIFQLILFLLDVDKNKQVGSFTATYFYSCYSGAFEYLYLEKYIRLFWELLFTNDFYV